MLHVFNPNSPLSDFSLQTPKKCQFSVAHFFFLVYFFGVSFFGGGCGQGKDHSGFTGEVQARITLFDKADPIKFHPHKVLAN